MTECNVQKSWNRPVIREKSRIAKLIRLELFIMDQNLVIKRAEAKEDINSR